jgi:ABC-type sugar transport system ATPase subunit
LRGAIRAGVALVSGDRRRLGLMLDKPVWENIATLCDRVVVIPQGRATTTLTDDLLTTHTVLEAMNTGEVAAA